MQDEATFIEMLKKVAPGTPLREGVENILQARSGALIVVSDNPKVPELCDGGFTIDAEFSGVKLYELAKMDGAIILNGATTKILRANVQLVPSQSIPTLETGTRHRSADRMSKQINDLVVAISERRHIVTLYCKGEKYILPELGDIIAKATQALSTLERYRKALDSVVGNLNNLEFEDFVTVGDVVNVIQRSEMVNRIHREIKRYIVELGHEGRLVDMQLAELVSGVWDEYEVLIRDYYPGYPADITPVLKRISDLHDTQLLNPVNLCKAMSFPDELNILDQPLSPRGFRLLRKIPGLPAQLPSNIIDNLVKTFSNLQGIVHASIEELDDVEGIGEVRARSIREGLKRLRENIIINRGY